MLKPLALLALSSLPALAGLKDGEVFANNSFNFGSTLFATDPPLSVTAADPNASASLNGSMAGFALAGSASISSSGGTAGAFASSRVDFADRITLTAPGVPTGQPLTIRIAWAVNGSVSSSASSAIRTLSELLVQGPAQTWRRQSNNYGAPVTNNPTGRVEFDFVVKEGVPEADNILLTAALQSVTGLPGSSYGGSYSANPSSSLNLGFIEVVSVKTQGGTALPIWNIVSDSLFVYGSGNGSPVPSNPTLTVAPSPLGPDHLRFTWPTSEIETYDLLSTTNGTTWSLEATVVGDDLPAVLDLERDGPQRLYRLEYEITGGGVTP